MKELLILGAGTGGSVAANMLNHKLNLKDWRITVVDRAPTHVYQPGLLFIPFRLYGYESESDVVKSIEAPIPKNVRFSAGDIELIDKESKKVETDHGRDRRRRQRRPASGREQWHRLRMAGHVELQARTDVRPHQRLDAACRL